MWLKSVKSEEYGETERIERFNHDTFNPIAYTILILNERKVTECIFENSKKLI